MGSQTVGHDWATELNQILKYPHLSNALKWYNFQSVIVYPKIQFCHNLQLNRGYNLLNSSLSSSNLQLQQEARVILAFALLFPPSSLLSPTPLNFSYSFSIFYSTKSQQLYLLKFSFNGGEDKWAKTDLSSTDRAERGQETFTGEQILSLSYKDKLLYILLILFCI